jgi:hypothetical protein
MYKLVCGLEPEGRRIVSYILPTVGDYEATIQFYYSPVGYSFLDIKAIYLIGTTLIVYTDVNVKNVADFSKIVEVEFLMVNPPATFKVTSFYEVDKIEEDIKKEGVRVSGYGFTMQGIDKSTYQIKRKQILFEMPTPITKKPIPDIPKDLNIPFKEKPPEELPWGKLQIPKGIKEKFTLLPKELREFFGITPEEGEYFPSFPEGIKEGEKRFSLFPRKEEEIVKTYPKIPRETDIPPKEKHWWEIFPLPIPSFPKKGEEGSPKPFPKPFPWWAIILIVIAIAFIIYFGRR